MPMIVLLLVCSFLSFLAPSAQGHSPTYSDGVFLSPTKTVSEISALPTETVAAYLKQIGTKHRYTKYAGQNGMLKAAYEDLRPMVVSENLDTQLTANDSFGASFSENDYSVYVAAFTSVDAYSLRVLVDRTQSVPGEELYVIDVNTLRAFGPYVGTTSKWMATTSGDTVVVVARVPGTARPGACVTELSHFFIDLDRIAKSSTVLSCEINIACETDATIKNLSAGVGMLLVPSGSNMLYGSGALIDVPSTDAYEPYFVTANHMCSTESQAENADVFWDYRSTLCGVENAPTYTSLPHSSGVTLLSTSSLLDATMIQLDSVPVGTYGRTYLGWDTRTPVMGESIIVMHHPEGSSMRISYGNVSGLDRTVNMEKLDGSLITYQHETKVGYSRGITEPGSSGSALLYDDGTYRIAGMLSGGNTAAACGAGPSVNYDFYASFSWFYDSIEPYLSAMAAPYISKVSPTSVTATTPTLLTLTGTNFKTTGTTHVIFSGPSPLGTLAVAATVIDATKMTVTSPAVAYSSSMTVTIQVSNPDAEASNSVSMLYKVDSSSGGIACNAGTLKRTYSGSFFTMAGDLLLLLTVGILLSGIGCFRKQHG